MKSTLNVFEKALIVTVMLLGVSVWADPPVSSQGLADLLSQGRLLAQRQNAHNYLSKVHVEGKSISFISGNQLIDALHTGGTAVNQINDQKYLVTFTDGNAVGVFINPHVTGANTGFFSDTIFITRRLNGDWHFYPAGPSTGNSVGGITLDLNVLYGRAISAGENATIISSDVSCTAGPAANSSCQLVSESGSTTVELPISASGSGVGRIIKTGGKIIGVIGVAAGTYTFIVEDLPQSRDWIDVASNANSDLMVPVTALTPIGPGYLAGYGVGQAIDYAVIFPLLDILNSDVSGWDTSHDPLILQEIQNEYYRQHAHDADPFVTYIDLDGNTVTIPVTDANCNGVPAGCNSTGAPPSTQKPYNPFALYTPDFIKK